MKELMLGNEAVARGLYEGGCRVISSYPGTPSTEITEYASEYDEMYSEWAPNEKVAMEVAFGASTAGARSFCAMKHVGLNVAADPLFTISYIGVNGGMVVGVADDPGMHSSQNEQDSRRIAIAAKLPMLEPSDSSDALEFTKQAFELSEKFDTPVMIRMSTRIAHSQSIVETSPRAEVPLKEYVKNPQKNIMLPGNAIRKHPVVEARTKAIAELAETSPLNRVEMGGTDIGVIAAGSTYQYAKEVLGDSVSYLKLGIVNPLPAKLIMDFAKKVKKVYVIEELDPVIEEFCKVNGVEVVGKDLFPMCGEFSQKLIADKMNVPYEKGVKVEEALPVRPPVMCAGCPHRGLFYVLSKNKCTVFGDIGCYSLGAMAPLNSVDAGACMGSSIPGLHGYTKALGEKARNAVAVLGDSTFLHTGINGLINTAYNGAPAVTIIADNSITGMTGHQENPSTGKNIKGDPATKIDIEALCRAAGINRVTVVDPYDLKELERVLKEELAADEPSVIISRRPCALLKYVKHDKPLTVNKDNCTSCKMCMRIGCPALSMKDDKACVDATQCVGCNLCASLCKFDALQKN